MVRQEDSARLEIDGIGREILRYLTENPGARDTFEGIAEWWLLEHDIRTATEKVRRAVGRLVSEGLLRESYGSDGRAHYELPAESKSDSEGSEVVDPEMDLEVEEAADG